ncbi:hypothetical protein ACHAXT_004533 [Thalassiosira profunda]
MAPPTARDFAKRPKAKVGKRAPARVNATDTSFKTASVAVRPQDRALATNKHHKDAALSAAARTELASSRGNALSALQLSLRHHAPAVRASGLKGIRDAVQSLSSLDDAFLGTSILESNLPSLLPNMCRCWLDEDDDVRGLAVNLFGGILSSLRSSPEQADLKCLAPFVPFLCAYASSALNSLDRDIRKDGAVIVGMLASSESHLSFASLPTTSAKEGRVSAMANETGKHVDTFIPPLERLLSSMSFGSRGRNGAASKDGARKRKRDGGSASQASTSSLAASDSTLLSLALLLQSSLASEGPAQDSSIETAGISRRLDPSLFVSGECTFVRGGSAQANSLSLFRDGRSNRNATPIRSVLDLPSMPLDDAIDGMESSMRAEEVAAIMQTATAEDTTTLEKVQRLTSLLETLRMKFVELTHSGRKPDEGSGLTLPTSVLDTLDALVQTMQLVHRSYQSLDIPAGCSQPESSSHRQPKKRGKKRASDSQDMGECIHAYHATAGKALSTLIEAFPICPMDPIALPRYELTNAGMCSTLAELGGDNASENSRGISSQWVDSVFSYVLPRLISTGEVEDDTTGEGAKAEGVATNVLLKVVSKLLLPRDGGAGESSQSYLLNSPEKRHELLDAFAEAFFPKILFPSKRERETQKVNQVYTSVDVPEREQRIKRLASTTMGQTAAMLLSVFINRSASGLVDPNSDEDRTDPVLLLQMVSVLPLYLTSWEGRLPNETGAVLASLVALVRQWPGALEENDDAEGASSLIKEHMNYLCLGLRYSLEELFRSKKRKPSIFERLPEQVQKLCVGLIGLLKCPSPALAKSLSTICSRPLASRKATEDDTAISESMCHYIMETMHSLRKTVPMPVYLTFLIDSCGPKALDTSTDPFSECVFSSDGSIAQLARFLTTSCDQPSTKVLPMISPVLQKWMAASSASDDAVLQRLVQSRAAVSILAAFTLDEVLSHTALQGDTDFVAPQFLQLDEKFDQLLLHCSVDQMELTARLWAMVGGRMDDLVEQQQYLAQLLGPITLLLRYRKGMFRHFVEQISRRVLLSQTQPQHENSSEVGKSTKKMDVAEVHMKALLLVLKSKDPASIADLVRSSEELQTFLIAASEDIEKSVSGGHLSHLGNKLLHQAKQICS